MICQYTNFILTNNSRLDKEKNHKNKIIFFTFIYILTNKQTNKYIKNSGPMPIILYDTIYNIKLQSKLP